MSPPRDRLLNFRGRTECTLKHSCGLVQPGEGIEDGIRKGRRMGIEMRGKGRNVQ